MNHTLELLKTIEQLSSSVQEKSFGDSFLERLLRQSSRNKFSLLFLHLLHEKEQLGKLASCWEREYQRYLKTIEVICKISKCLTNSGIHHAFFKTLRPYISATVDIDLIIFGGEDQYMRAIARMEDEGYRKKVQGPASTTFEDTKIEIGIDLYEEIAVSYVTYIDKDRLVGQTTAIDLDGRHISNLNPESDLLAIVAHSIIKENMFTLSEYYTYLRYLDKLDVDNFIRLAKETHLQATVRTHTSITALLCRTTTGNVPQKITRVLEEFGEDHMETTAVVRNDFKMPHKYHPFTVFKCLTELGREAKTRRGLALQLFHTANPEFSRQFLRKLTGHITRETY